MVLIFGYNFHIIIVLSKMNASLTALANIKLEKDVAKKMKRKKESLENETDVQVHAECKSPQSCKKCRIMRRLGKKLINSSTEFFFFHFF